MKTECIGDYVITKRESLSVYDKSCDGFDSRKWKAVILYHLKDAQKRYSELRKEIPNITEMTLSLQLKQLEKDGLVLRKAYGQKPPIKVVYSLTDFGKTFIPVLKTITDWGNQVVTEKGEFANNSF